MAEKLGPEKRHAFIHNGKKVFEWDQTLDEVNMYIGIPKGVPTKLFHCAIHTGHVEVGIRGSPPYLNHDLTLPVKIDLSFWMMDEIGPTLLVLRHDIQQNVQAIARSMQDAFPHSACHSKYKQITRSACHRPFQIREFDGNSDRGSGGRDLKEDQQLHQSYYLADQVNKFLKTFTGWRAC